MQGRGPVGLAVWVTDPGLAMQQTPLRCGQAWGTTAPGLPLGLQTQCVSHVSDCASKAKDFGRTTGNTA